MKMFIPEINHNYEYTGKKLLVSKKAFEKELKRNEEYRYGGTEYMYSNKTEAYRRLSLHADLRG